MMDIFEKPMPIIGSAIPEYTTGVLRDRLFDQINEGWYPNLMFLLLTKRPTNINKMIPESWKENPPANVMFGTSVVNQETADKLIPQLLQVKGKFFLSCEPLLGHIDFEEIDTENVIYRRKTDNKITVNKIGNIDWVIVGGESGHHARPMHPDWARRLRDQCKSSEIPFLFKQWGEYAPILKPHAIEKNEIILNPDGNQMIITTNPSAVVKAKVGKKIAGNYLDGKQYLEFPK